MADITISLSDDRKLSIKDIGVSQFLTIWDDLLASKVVRGLVDEKQITLSCDEKMESEVLETFGKNRYAKIEADNEEISSKKIKELVQEGLFAAGLVIEEDVEDGDLTAEINKMFDVDISPFSIVTLNEVTDKFMKGVNQLDATAAAYFAAKIAATFMWERMKDEYIFGLKKRKSEREGNPVLSEATNGKRDNER